MILPMFAMVLLTFAVFVYGLVMRINAVRAGKVHGHYFKVFDPRDRQIPEKILQQKNHVDNLFQVPTLFYAACITAMVVGPTESMATLAWCFVATRMIHSFIHLTYNNVLHRLPAFILSNIALMVLWIKIVMVHSG